MQAAAKVVPEAQKTALMAAGEAVKASVDRRAPNRLRNVGLRGANIGVRVYPPRGGGNRVDVLVRATGPFHLIENPIGPHLIEPRAQGAAVDHPLAIPGTDTGFRAYAHHPGVRRMRGSGPFFRGVREAAPLVPKIVQKVAVQAPLRAII